MFQELLTNLQLTIKQAKLVSGSLNKQLKQSQVQLNKTNDYFHDPMRSLGKAVSFTKSERFKNLQKEQLKTIDAFHDQRQYQPEQNQIKGITFTKSQRFIADKQDQLTLINPNYAIIMPNNKQAPKIQTPSKTQLLKSRISQTTMTSQTQIGPGKYFINQNQFINNKKNISFSKQKRFHKPKIQCQDTPLYVNDGIVKKRPPSMAILKKKIQKNKKQISIKQQQQLRQKLKFIYWKSIPLQLDRLLKKVSKVPIIKQSYFNLKNLTGQQKRCAILMLLDRLNYQRGGYQNNIQKQLGNGPCIIYRKSTPKPFKFSQMEPGPNFYYPQDDFVKPAILGFTFYKNSYAEKKQFDHRDYQINQEYFRKGGNIVIMPQHQPHVLTQQQIRSLNRGPGFYDTLFSQVQKRTDIGVLKFQQITQKNARQNNCIQIKQTNDGIYFPSYTAIDPKIGVPIYKQPANIQPMHVPDKLLFPQHWLFYDGNLNKVKAQIAKNVFIGNGLNFTQYQQFTKKYKAFKKYIQFQKRQVEGLEYEPKYDVIDAHVQGFDMGKKSQKTLIDPIVKPQFQLDGDNLILSPQKPKKYIANIQFNKMIGHPDEEIGPDDVIEGDVLIIQPKKISKHVAQIDFKKMSERPQILAQKNQDEQPLQGDRILIDPKLPNKKIQNIDFTKQIGRQGIQNLQNQREQKVQLILSPEKKNKIKGFVDMQRMTSVRLVPYLRKKKQEKASTIQKKRRQN